MAEEFAVNGERYASPGWVLCAALAASDLSGAEHSVMWAAVLHALGVPWKEGKGAKSVTFYVSPYFLGANSGYARSGICDPERGAIDKLLTRKVLRKIDDPERGGGYLINKYVSQWLDKDGAPLFVPGSKGMKRLLNHLDQHKWSEPEADRARAYYTRAKYVPRPLDRTWFENASTPVDAAQSVPNANPSTVLDVPNAETSTPVDYGVHSSGRVPPANPPEKPEPGRIEATQLDSYEIACCSKDGRDLVDLVRYLVPVLEATADEVSRGLAAFCGKLPATSLIRAAEELHYKYVIRGDDRERPFALLRTLARDPRKCSNPVELSFASWLEANQAQLETEKRSKSEQVASRAAEQVARSLSVDASMVKKCANDPEGADLADAFQRRPSAEQRLAAKQLKAATATDLQGIRKRVAGENLTQWISAGCPSWRDHAPEKRPSIVAAQAAGELALRAVIERRGGIDASMLTGQ